MRRRKRERNLRLLRLELADNPRDAFVLFNLANAYVEEGALPEALRNLKGCLEHAPPGASYLPKTYFLLAGTCHLLGRDDEALHYCRAGKVQFPQTPSIWFQEGIVLLARGDWAGARHAFETILALPRQANYAGVDANLAGCRTRHNLAYIYRRLGLLDKAEEQWLLAIAEAPEFEPGWLALVEVYLDRGRPTAAEALLRRLEGKPYQEIIGPTVRARLRLAQGDVQAACRLLEEALVRRPHALWLRTLLADILLRVAGDGGAAEKHLRAILTLAPNELQTRKKLAGLLTCQRS